MRTSFYARPVRDLAYLVTELAKAREIEEELERQVKAVQADIDALIEDRFGAIQRLLNHELGQARLEAKALYEAVRLYACQHYDGQDKHPHPAVSLGEYTVLNYDESEALKWAQKTGLALKLDKRGFEKIAKASDIPCVEVKTEIRARIKTDLSEYA